MNDHTIICLTDFLDDADPHCPCQAPDPTLDKLRDQQSARVTQLLEDLETFQNEGHEWYARMTRDEIIVASSLARLIHKA